MLPPQDPISDNTVGIVAIFTVFFVFPIAIAMARFIWKRASGSTQAQVQDSSENTHRLIEMPRSLDAMAVEIERIAENQRFVTKIMNERPAAALKEGTADRRP